MPGSVFSAEVQTANGHTVIRLRGDVNRDAMIGVESAYEEAAGTGAVILDFTEVGYINSTGIALIVGLLARARTDGRQVGAYGLNDHYREIFQITRIADFMSIHQDQDAAISAQGGEEIK